MTFRHLTAALMLPLFIVACDDNPTEPEGAHDHELSADLVLSSDHVHTLSEVTFTVTVTDDHGEVVTDFDTLRVERRLAESDTWSEIELARSGDAFAGTYTFNTSGEYDIRVVGMQSGDSDTEVLYEMPDPLEVGRAHVEAGGYRVEFESFPGHVHEGETVALRFWVKEAEADASGTRSPVTDLDAEIHCDEAEGGSESHPAQEIEPGVYEAEHTFGGAGEMHAALHFTGASGSAAEADFHFHVSHGH